MKKDKWADWLADLKRHEKPEAVLMLAGSAELMRIAVAWSGTPVVRKKRLSTCREDDIWRWLWDNANYSREEFLRRLPVTPERANRMFESLVANRVLYPDGTVNSFVQKYLQERVLSLFKFHRPARSSCRVARQLIT